MPAHSDHIRRDAQHAARQDIQVEIQKYVRRMNEAAKAHIDAALASAEGVIDGSALGREAARSAIVSYTGGGAVHAVVESGSPAIESYAASS